MFNALSTAEVVLSMGRVLNDAGRADGARDDYQRGQLLSAYSVARHLAAETTAAPELLTWFRDAVAAELDEKRATEIRATSEPVRLGELVGDALAELRATPGPAAEATRDRVRAVLREMTDREVAALVSPPR
ncbi:MAG TPA: hypothetical protein VFE65_08445 [Pseudonocardia sp.]|jgi:hypothetical protein|nr:hypothetical protein [Pseudonocardia sp.]